MKVVSVINYKGGVGKTTLTACLASCLQDKGVNVLLVDLDPQCNLTGEVLPDRLEELYPLDGQSNSPKTLKEWYRALRDGRTENLEELILQDRRRRLSIVPSHLDLLDVDTNLGVRLWGTDIREVHSDPRALHQRYYDVLDSLRSQLRVIEESRAAKGRGFDLVLLDCPPNFNIVTQTAIVASDAILIPVRPNPLSAMSMDHLIRKRGDLVRDFNKSAKALGLRDAELTAPKIMGVVPMMWKARQGDTPTKGNEAVIRILRELEGDGVVFFDGVRHNETLFLKNKAPWVPFSSGGGEPHDRARNDVRATCRKIGEALEVIKPSFEEMRELLQWLQDTLQDMRAHKGDAEAKKRYDLKQVVRLEFAAPGSNFMRKMKEGLRHIPGRGTDAFNAQVGRRFLKAAMSVLPDREPLAKWAAGKIYAEFLRECGRSKEDAERESSEFFERSD